MAPSGLVLVTLLALALVGSLLADDFLGGHDRDASSYGAYSKKGVEALTVGIREPGTYHYNPSRETFTIFCFVRGSLARWMHPIVASFSNS